MIMKNFLISPMAPWLISVGILLIGLGAFRFGRRREVSLTRWGFLGVGATVVVLGVLLVLGASLNAYKHAEIRAAHPPPGKIVDVNGIGIHVWCGGDNSEQTVLLIPGGYGQALWFAHIKKALESHYRTCLIDRPGLGWSEARPLENETELVMSEMRDALLAAGEKFPITIVGHSYGGFYAANFAAAYPEDVSAIVLLDPTAPSHNLAMFTNECHRPDYFRVLAVMFGAGFIKSLNPMYRPGKNDAREAVGEDWETLVGFEVRPSALLGTNSAFNAPCRKPLSAIPPVDGLLGDLPILQIIQVPEPVEERPAWLAGLTDFEYANHTAWYKAALTDYPRMSSNSRSMYAPSGAGHNFPHSERDFTIAQILDFLDSLSDAKAEPSP